MGARPEQKGPRHETDDHHAGLRRWRTYDLFAGYWGVREDLENPIVGALNSKLRYVASTTLTDPKWSNTTVISGDLAAAIGELKAKPGGELQVHGSGTLTRWLLEDDLVDEVRLLVCPWWSARARGCSPKPARTSRLTWSNRKRSRRA